MTTLLMIGAFILLGIFIIKATKRLTAFVMEFVPLFVQTRPKTTVFILALISYTIWGNIFGIPLGIIITLATGIFFIICYILLNVHVSGWFKLLFCSIIFLGALSIALSPLVIVVTLGAVIASIIVRFMKTGKILRITYTGYMPRKKSVSE